MSNFGLFVRGKRGNLILDGTNPVLVQREMGNIHVTWTSAKGMGLYYQGYGACEVAYQTPVPTQEPPLVFGTPDSISAGGIGHFTHRGGPGNWTGFCMTFIDSLRYQVRRVSSSNPVGPRVGQFTGWQYRVCSFGQLPQSTAKWGMRLWSKTLRSDHELIFDSGWPLVPFRGLLQDWVQNGSGGYYEPESYWGKSFWNSTQIDDANRYGEYRHTWGEGSDLGILLSSLCAMDVVADAGNNIRIKTLPMIGFHDTSRQYLYCTLAYGTIQHAGTAGPALNNFGLLTADFSRT